MNKLLSTIGLSVIIFAPIKVFSMPAVFPSITYQEDKPKKEPMISMRSDFYKSASGVIESVFKQASIVDFSIDEKVKEMKPKNIQFKNKTLKQAIEILSKFYNIKFEIIELDKDKLYSVTVK